MRKYSLIGLILTLSIGILYNTSAQQAARNISGQQDQKFQEEILLLDAIQLDGFKAEEFNINTYVTIPHMFLTMEELEEKQGEIMEVLGVNRERVIVNMDNMYDPRHQDMFEDLLEIEEEIILEQRVEDEGHNEIILFIPNDEGNMTVVKLLSTQIVGYNTETHIIVDIVQNKGYKYIVETSNQVEELLKKYGENIETTINLTGGQAGRLGKDQEREIQDLIFKLLKAKRLEVLEDEDFTSITAHSPLIGTYIEYGGKKVNLQLAIRYSQYEDKTYLWLGTPLITISY